MKKLISPLLTCTFACGCSAFQPRQESVTIVASEPAEIRIDNNPVGNAPVHIMLDRDRTYAVSADADGRVATASIGRRVSGTGALDIAGAIFFLFPVIGCFTPGFWELDPTTVRVQLPGR
jgi:hypothetical protein